MKFSLKMAIRVKKLENGLLNYQASTFPESFKGSLVKGCDRTSPSIGDRSS
ncbi:MAG: hypothetical protein KME25_31015 [Symplocastrum torsivum CPER-KK1]|uniref:Uncharacterized protein n=1 Tax=Symplocastrum torsivum CPER-KK1 TaxID=450513 RepID=A0A951UDD2_9CYAN|nr:hypothetical protein [Symplocastrum torsivum CPER-KK1]